MGMRARVYEREDACGRDRAAAVLDAQAHVSDGNRLGAHWQMHTDTTRVDDGPVVMGDDVLPLPSLWGQQAGDLQ